MSATNDLRCTILGLRTVSEANVHTHWRQRAKRAKTQRFVTASTMRATHDTGLVSLPCTVTLTRIAPRSLDSDNAVGALKHVRDGVADWLGIDDREPRITWLYAQERGKPKQYGVRIEVVRARHALTGDRFAHVDVWDEGKEGSSSST